MCVLISSLTSVIFSLEFAPKRKIVKKMNAPEVNHTKKVRNLAS